MVMVCFSVIIERKPPWARGSRGSRYKGQRANAGGLPLQINSIAEWYATPPNTTLQTDERRVSVLRVRKGGSRAARG